MTKAIALATTKISTIRADFRRHWNKQIEDSAVAIISWLLSKREVQQIIANQFSNNVTPLCDALQIAVASSACADPQATVPSKQMKI